MKLTIHFERANDSSGTRKQVYTGGCRNHPSSVASCHTKTISLMLVHECSFRTQQEKPLRMSHHVQERPKLWLPPSIYGLFTTLPAQMHSTNQGLCLPLGSILWLHSCHFTFSRLQRNSVRKSIRGHFHRRKEKGFY